LSSKSFLFSVFVFVANLINYKAAHPPLGGHCPRHPEVITMEEIAHEHPIQTNQVKL